LSELRTLRLDHNELLRVPKNIAGLQGLHTFTISTNKLKELPNEIGDLLALQVWCHTTPTDSTRRLCLDLPSGYSEAFDRVRKMAWLLFQRALNRIENVCFLRENIDQDSECSVEEVLMLGEVTKEDLR
jgi:Leucine-rich repeat (LRR) protein